MHRRALFARQAGFVLSLYLSTASSMAVAEQPSYAELLDTVQQLQQRLDNNDAQLQQLQQRDERRQAWEASVVERLPMVQSNWSVHTSDDEGNVEGDFQGANVHSDFPHEDVCPGCPSYCADCLERLGWNKANGWRIVPFGRLRGEYIYSTAPYINDAIVASLAPNVPGIDEDAYSIHAKQSQINFAISGPDCGCWQTGGVIAINFMGAQPLRNFSGANIFLAYGEIKNDEWRFAFGRMLDLFGPASPSTVNQIQQRGTGNVGIYRGAFHVDRYLTVSDKAKWTLSGRVSQQDISDYQGIPAVRGKDNGWPNIEARVGLELGPMCDYGRPLEIGLSGVVGEIQAVEDPFIDFDPDIIFFPGSDEIEQTRGACVDFQWKGPKLGLRGELWWGQAAGTYFVATLQSLNPENDQAVESVGGWAEVYCKVNPCVTMHVGYGVDDPRNNTLGFVDPLDPNAVGQISYNEVAWWNVIWNVTDYFDMEFEVSHRRTRYLVATAHNEGTLFHFASTLKF